MATPSRQSTKATLDKVLARGLTDILDKVSRAHGVSREEICGRRRTGPIARARHELWWHMRNMPMTYDEIGGLFGRLHSTVVRGIVAYRRAGLVPEVPLDGARVRAINGGAKRAPQSPLDVADLEGRLKELAAGFAKEIAAALRNVPIHALAAVPPPKAVRGGRRSTKKRRRRA